ncbi:uncharacterized protein LOC120090573 [Benincasa hispida]|uniref:uncharacterized protein LOC120090573 n=1 Tax=Benincasa hispida TaxID=102211 RepID=UPI0019008EF1|nr:uncharacterized protein LOC120090573 [Benincasa hispida]
MEVYSEVQLEEDRSRAMNGSVVATIELAVFGVKSSGSEWKNTSNTNTNVPVLPSLESSPDILVSVLLTKQMPKITYYRKNLIKETSVVPSKAVQESVPASAQVQDPVVSDNDDENLPQESEQSKYPDTEKWLEKTDDYDTTLDMSIVLWKGTRSCIKYLMHSFLTYSSLSPSFKAFTTQLDALAIPTSVHTAMEVLEWKAVVMEEMKALEVNKTLDLMAFSKGHKIA